MSDEKDHIGKGMVEASDEKVTAILECTGCGRITVGPIPLIHLRTIIKMLKVTADQIGIPEEHDSTTHITEAYNPSTRGGLEAGRRKFEEMDILGARRDKDASNWDGEDG